MMRFNCLFGLFSLNWISDDIARIYHSSYIDKWIGEVFLCCVFFVLSGSTFLYTRIKTSFSVEVSLLFIYVVYGLINVAQVGLIILCYQQGIVFMVSAYTAITVLWLVWVCSLHIKRLAYAS